MEKRPPKRTTLPCPRIIGRAYMKQGFRSLGLSCHPRQAREFNDIMHQHNVTGVQYDEKGHCKVSSEQDYAAVTKSLEMDQQHVCYPVPE